MLFSGLEKSHLVPFMHIQNISVMNIQFPNPSCFLPFPPASAVPFPPSLCHSKHKLLVLIFMTSPRSVLSQFITGMLASWPSNTRRHCSSITHPGCRMHLHLHCFATAPAESSSPSWGADTFSYSCICLLILRVQKALQFCLPSSGLWP